MIISVNLDVRELAARIRAIVRRQYGLDHNSLIIGALCIDLNAAK